MLHVTVSLFIEILNRRMFYDFWLFDHVVLSHLLVIGWWSPRSRWPFSDQICPSASLLAKANLSAIITLTSFLRLRQSWLVTLTRADINEFLLFSLELMDTSRSARLTGGTWPWSWRNLWSGWQTRANQLNTSGNDHLVSEIQHRYFLITNISTEELSAARLWPLRKYCCSKGGSRCLWHGRHPFHNKIL